MILQLLKRQLRIYQSVSANINSYDTMIDMFIKSNSDLADNLTKLQEVLPQIKDVLTGTKLMLLILPINLLIMSQTILQTRLMRSLKL